MSISTIQEKLFNKGCGSALIVVAALAMGASVFSSQCNTGAASQQSQAALQGAVALVGSIPVSGERIQQLSQEQVQRSGMETTDILVQSYALAGATNSVLNSAAVLALLEKGPKVSEAELDKVATAFIEKNLGDARKSLIAKKLLKPNASDADFEKALKGELQGKTLAEFRTNFLKEIKAKFNDPKTQMSTVESFAPQILAGRLAAKSIGDAAALKESYKTYFLKRIFFSETSGAKETPDVRGAKALADLKSGVSFDKLMDTVSNDPGNGKPIHESTTPIPGEAMGNRPEYAELKGKAALAMTGLVTVPGGKAIYQIASIQDSTPADFEANKQKYRDEKAADLGQAEVETQTKALLASDEVKWNSAGYHAIYAAVSAFSGDSLKKAVPIAEAAYKSENPAEKKLGAMALLVMADGRQRFMPMDPQTTIDQIAAYEAAQKVGIADAALNLKLAKLYGDQKNGAKASEALITASKSNNRYDPTGETTFRDINGLALKLQGSKVMTAAQLEAVQAQQAVWSQAFKQNAEATAAAKKQMEIDQKRNAEEIERQKAEAAKKAPSVSDEATKKANEAEIARQKAEAAKGGTPPVKVEVPPSATTAGTKPPASTTGGQ